MRAALFLVLVGCSGPSTSPPTELRIVRIDADGGSSIPPMVEDASVSTHEGGIPPVDSLCDRDGDGYRAMTSPCNGDDCDDTDPRAHPHATFTYDPVTEMTLGDWNCDNLIELEVVAIAVKCDLFPSANSCANRSGFSGYPDCGELAEYVACEWTGTKCITASTTQRREGCR